MIYSSPENPNSHLTVKDRKWPSFPTKMLFSKGLIKGDVLDFGSGLGIDIKFLKKNDINVTGFDPYYKPEYPNQKFDTILCNYVLNILLPKEQANVLMAVSELLKKSGKAYYSVRRDIKRKGFRYNPKKHCQTYQCNVVLPFKSLIKTEHCEVYEYQHINQIKNNNPCSFCSPNIYSELITESALVYAILKVSSKYKGHILIIPKRHVQDYIDLTYKEHQSCLIMIERIKIIYWKLYKSSKFKIEILTDNNNLNNNFHAHINLIPQL